MRRFNRASAGGHRARHRRLIHFRRLRRAQLPLDSVALARALLGCVLVTESDGDGRVAARIVETEAYVPGDAASHAYRGETPRTRSMFLSRGHAYVYFIYGTWYCLNVTGDAAGIGAAVLIRAAQPLGGLERMRLRRGCDDERLLCRGPGRLAQAFAITRLHDGLDLCAAGPLWLAAGEPPASVGESVRIGLRKETARVLRFYEANSAFLSGPAALNRSP